MPNIKSHRRLPHTGIILAFVLQFTVSAQVLAQQDPVCAENQNAVLTVFYNVMGNPFTRKSCGSSTGRNRNFPDSAIINLLTVEVEPGYRMLLYTEPDFKGLEYPPIRGTQDVGPLTVRSYIVEKIPGRLSSTCVQAGGVATFWSGPYYEGDFHCVLRDKPTLGQDEVRAVSVHVAPGYKLVAMVGTEAGTVEQRLFTDVGDYGDLRNDGGGESLIIKAYTPWPSLRIESIEENNGEVSIVYRVSGTTESKTVTVVKQGRFGITPRLRNDGPRIEYSPDEGLNWEKLLDLASLEGGDGNDGADGVAPLLRTTATAVEYSQDGGNSWRELITFRALTGDKGDKGSSGSQLRIFDPTMTCGVSSQGVIRFDIPSASLLVCDGLNWLSYAKTGTRPGTSPDQ